MEFKEVPSTSINAPLPVVKDFGELRPFVENFFNKKDINNGIILSYPSTTIGEFIDILFLLLKEVTIKDATADNELFKVQSILKAIYKDNNNLEKLLTMLLGSIIKICNEYKKNNTSTDKSKN